MIRGLLIGFGLIVVGAAAPSLATAIFPVVIMVGIIWIGLWHLKASYVRRWRGGRR